MGWQGLSPHVFTQSGRLKPWLLPMMVLGFQEQKKVTHNTQAPFKPLFRSGLLMSAGYRKLCGQVKFKSRDIDSLFLGGTTKCYGQFFPSVTVMQGQGSNPDCATYYQILGKLFNFFKPQEDGGNRACLEGCEDWDNACKAVRIALGIQ